ncbi:Cytochrome P450 82C2 [Morella rubra]|uniref:Cytochrome P450 82C2 n=1 Tax=Morella rubra TaxID=262757 RepID=A0A6A1W6I0_9ROSI|nr:Cytochrome P450 82C2 [Morella rubra]
MAIIFAFFLLLLLLIWMVRRIQKPTDRRSLPPQAGGAWPMIGHLHLLGGEPVHITLGKIADKCGPIFTIRLGVHQTLVVSSPEMAKDCLTTNDKAFANRPKGLAAELMAYDSAVFAFSPYGSYWRQLRKIATQEFLSNQRLEMLKNLRGVRGERIYKRDIQAVDQERQGVSGNEEMVRLHKPERDIDNSCGGAISLGSHQGRD